MAANLSGDNWNYNGSPLTDMDFFQNPLANYPIDTVTPVHAADALDDVHPSNVLAYLNSLVHYTVIYQDNPINLPPANGVPVNIADIFKDVVWNTVINDPRTGVTGSTTSINESKNELNISLYPNPTKNYTTINFGKELKEVTISVIDITGKEVYSLNNVSGKKVKLSTTNLVKGIYLIKTRTSQFEQKIVLIKD